MSGRRAERQIRKGFTLGEGVAEFDQLLAEAFVETWLYRAASSRGDQKCFLVGRTGSGKSACFRKLKEEHPERFIQLSPDDLSLPYIAELDVVQKLKRVGVHLDPLFVALWKHVLIIEIIRHRYKVDSIGAQQRFLSGLIERVRRDRSKQQALAYLEEFEGRFWCETDERVREIIQKFESQVHAEAGGSLGAGFTTLTASGGEAQSEAVSERVEVANRFQRLVNKTQLPRLNKMEMVIDEDILDSQQLYTYIVIDDLDRDWADEEVTNDLIRCLFRAVVDLKRVRNLKVLVALRTNIFESLDFGPTAGQQEKYRTLIHHVKWTESELRGLLDSRAAVAASKHGLSGVENVHDLLPRSNSTMGDPLDYILARTLQRPRDAIAFLNACLESADGKDRLTWKAIKAAEVAYSNDRLLALRDEWKPTYPGIDEVLRKFSRSPSTLDWEQMERRLAECALLMAERDFVGVGWLTQLTSAIWSSSGDRHEQYHALIRLLYNIGFIGCITSTEDSSQRLVDEPPAFNYDAPNFADHVSNLRNVSGFVVHPAFMPALDIPG